jgi:hypothetical protein
VFVNKPVIGNVCLCLWPHFHFTSPKLLNFVLLFAYDFLMKEAKKG